MDTEIKLLFLYLFNSQLVKDLQLLSKNISKQWSMMPSASHDFNGNDVKNKQ